MVNLLLSSKPKLRQTAELRQSGALVDLDALPGMPEVNIAKSRIRVELCALRAQEHVATEVAYERRLPLRTASTSNQNTQS